MNQDSFEQLKNRLSKKKIELSEDDVKALLPFFERYRQFEGEAVYVMFSGGIDTSFITHFLQHVIGAKVTTVTANLGSVTEPANMQEVVERSNELGADAHEVIDLREKLAESGLDAIHASAKLGPEGHYPASSLSRAVICDGVVKLAKRNQIRAVFHGSNGSQNNPYRFEKGLTHYGVFHNYADLKECTPNLDNQQQSEAFRKIQKRYLIAAGIRTKSAEFETTVSHDRNLLGDEWEEAEIADPARKYDLREKIRSKYGGVFIGVDRQALKENGSAEFSLMPENMAKLAQLDDPLPIGIRFEKGRPVALRVGSGEWRNQTPLELFETLNQLGLERQIGIVRAPESRPSGINASEIHIAPAMHILHKAHNHLREYLGNRHEGVVTNLNQLSLEWSHWVMEQNSITEPFVQRMTTLFKKFDESLNAEVFLELEPQQVVNITSTAGRKTMEGTVPPATKGEVISHNRKITEAFSGTGADADEPDPQGAGMSYLRNELEKMLKEIRAGRQAVRR